MQSAFRISLQAKTCVITYLGHPCAILSLALLVSFLGSVSASSAATFCPELPGLAVKVGALSTDQVNEEIVAPEQIAQLAMEASGRLPHPLIVIRYKVSSTGTAVPGAVPARDGGFCAAPEKVELGFGPANAGSSWSTKPLRNRA